MINVYIDGACANNGKKNAISGYGVYFGDNDIRNEYKKIDGNKHTNNIAELTAFIRCLEILQENISNNEQINVYTDSEYVIKCASSYGEKLYRNNWKTSNNKIPPNLELVKKAFELYRNSFNVKLIHIHAHTNKEDKHSIGNKMADKLANNAIGHQDCPYDKVFINISYNNKDEAKKLGAKWDPKNKSWYYNNNISNDNKNKLNLLEKKIKFNFSNFT
jgi:ribonuclease HI